MRFGDSNYWDKKAVVLEEVSPRSYMVRTENWQVFRRNSKSLKTENKHTQNHFLNDQKSEGSSLTWRPMILSMQTFSSSSSSSSSSLENVHSVKTNYPPIPRRSSCTVRKPDLIYKNLCLKAFESKFLCFVTNRSFLCCTFFMVVKAPLFMFLKERRCSAVVVTFMK